MKSLRKNKPFSLVFVTLFAFLLAAATVSQAGDSPMVVEGTIVSADPDSGKVSVIDDAGKTVELTASPDTDLKTVQKGDAVKVEYDKEGVIKAIHSQK